MIRKRSVEIAGHRTSVSVEAPFWDALKELAEKPSLQTTPGLKLIAAYYASGMDEAAIEAHRKAPHFAKWREAADVCVVNGSQVNTFANQLFHHAPN